MGTDFGDTRACGQDNVGHLYRSPQGSSVLGIGHWEEEDRDKDVETSSMSYVWGIGK